MLLNIWKIICVTWFVVHENNLSSSIFFLLIMDVIYIHHCSFGWKRELVKRIPWMASLSERCMEWSLFVYSNISKKYFCIMEMFLSPKHFIIWKCKLRKRVVLAICAKANWPPHWNHGKNLEIHLSHVTVPCTQIMTFNLSQKKDWNSIWLI
jgi:hypothetical protein